MRKAVVPCQGLLWPWALVSDCIEDASGCGNRGARKRRVCGECQCMMPYVASPPATTSRSEPNLAKQHRVVMTTLTVTGRDHLLVPHAKFSWPCSPVCRCILPRLFIYIHIEIRFCLVRLLCLCAATFVYSSPHSHYFALPPSCPREHRYLIPTSCMIRNVTFTY
jgi:hypothetical protein